MEIIGRKIPFSFRESFSIFPGDSFHKLKRESAVGESGVGKGREMVMITCWQFNCQVLSARGGHTYTLKSAWSASRVPAERVWYGRGFWQTEAYGRQSIYICMSASRHHQSCPWHIAHFILQMSYVYTRPILRNALLSSDPYLLIFVSDKERNTKWEINIWNILSKMIWQYFNGTK